MVTQLRRVRTNTISSPWAPEPAIVRQGMLQVWGITAEYRVLQPAPTQWVIMALVSCDLGAPRRLVVTVGQSENDALTHLARHLRLLGSAYSIGAYATEWAMSELND